VSRRTVDTRSPAVELPASIRIVEALKKDLITGALQPGSLIVESQVGARFGVSKTPAREALLRLCEMGLVAVMPGKGYAVTKLSWQQIKNLFELRLMLEAKSAELAATRATEAEIAALEAMAVRPRLKKLSVEGLLDYNLNFHRAIWQATRNERMVQMLLEVMEDLMRAMHAAMLTENADEMVEQHMELISLIGARDGAGARRFMETHVDTTRRRLLDI